MIRRLIILTLIAAGATWLLAWYGQHQRYRTQLLAAVREGEADLRDGYVTFSDDLHATAPGATDHYRGFSFKDEFDKLGFTESGSLTFPAGEMTDVFTEPEPPHQHYTSGPAAEARRRIDQRILGAPSTPAEDFYRFWRKS